MTGSPGLADRQTASAPTPQGPGATNPLPLLAVRGLERRYRLPRRTLFGPAPTVHALRGIDFELGAGRSLGVVGESGSGKSTLARLVMALERPDAGQVVYGGADLATLGPAALRRARAGFQMVFQDPYGSLDPRQTVADIVGEPLSLRGTVVADERRAVAAAMLDAVGLGAADLDRHPHQFSGGQRQRIAIARALVTRPRLIVADEPVSALDVSVQAQVLNLLVDLQEAFGLAYLLISHDLGVVGHLCDEVLVLYQGRVVERGEPSTLFAEPAHPYTRALIAALPGNGAHRRAVRDESPGRRVAPDPLASADAMLPPSTDAASCAFAPRCPWREPRCGVERPALRMVGARHAVACHLAERVLQAGPALQEARPQPA
jgi:peptide/nickel transport system ATP-binding protein